MSILKITFFSAMIVILNSCDKTELKQIDDLSGKSISETNIKDTCDSPDADINCSFRNMPAELTSIMTISKPDEPGEDIIISGKILHSDSITPFSGVIMYAYHTDSTGYYSKKGDEAGVRKWQGHLYGWCATDSNGYYEIRTIKPGRYPSNKFPAHIHAVIKIPENKRTFYINDFVFKDDSLVNDKYISSLQFPGGTGVVELKKSVDGILLGQRNIILPD